MDEPTFPQCRKARPPKVALAWHRWLASEPFRVFFPLGALWSLAGVCLWPLYYLKMWDSWPGLAHARLMVEVFGGAFVTGFLGTAGPRMASAPKLTVAELLLLLVLHTGTGVSLLLSKIHAGDLWFAAMTGLLLAGLLIRIAVFRKEAPPPQLVLALGGLLCGLAGAILWSVPGWLTSPENIRLANLLLYQGFLLLPVLGIGSFLFPRMLGGDFGEPADARDAIRKGRRAWLAAAGILSSFPLEAYGQPPWGCLLRAAVVILYLVAELRGKHSGTPLGTLSKSLFWALGSGVAGLVATGFFPVQRIGSGHLLYAGGFGLLMLVVSSRVIFGHSGCLAGFSRKSKTAFSMTLLVVLAALTRASADFWPKIAVSHHQYAALLWVAAVAIWLVWHRKRFGRRDGE